MSCFMSSSLSQVSRMVSRTGTVSRIHLIQSTVAVSTLKKPVIFLLHSPSFLNVRSLHLNNASRLTKEKLPSCDTSVIKLLLSDDDSLDLVILILMLLLISFHQVKDLMVYSYRIIIFVVNNSLIKVQLKYFFYLIQSKYLFLSFCFFPQVHIYFKSTKRFQILFPCVICMS